MIRRRLYIALIAILAFVLAACGGGGDSSSAGPTEIAVWHGYQDTEGDVFKGLVAQYNKEHPDVKVSELYSSNDLVLQKVLTAVRGGSAPDVAYMFGSWSPNIAKIPQVVDMKDEVAKPDWKWDDFYQAERDAATVGDKVVGVPALVDNLAIVYNKKLFADAGVAPPSPDWTWDDFRAAAAKLTDPSKGQFGWLIPADGSEDTVWHYAPMLWEAGGDILSPDNEKAVFNSEAGVKALTVLQQMAVTDKSLYLDTTNENGPKLMNSGKVAMLVTGPWDLSQLADIDYDVQVMPTFAGSSGGHQTIAGPGQLGGVQQRRQEEAGGDRLRQVVDGAGTGQGVLAGHRRSAHPRLGGSGQGRPGQAQRERARHSRFRGKLEQRQEGQAAGRAVPRNLRVAGAGDRVRDARQGTAGSRAELRRPGRRRGAGGEVGRCPRTYPNGDCPDFSAGPVASAAGTTSPGGRW